jgi:hypothetical protein
MELVVAMAAGTFLVAGMGSVMFIGRQIAYTPTDSTRRTTASEVVSQICDELRYATYVIQQTPQILEFVVADRNSDGTSEKFRYEWSGVAGAPLRKSINGGTAVEIAPAVNSFNVTFQQTQTSTTYTTTVDSSQQLLLTTASVASTNRRDIDATNHMAQVIAPTAFASIPTGALSWNMTRVDFYGGQNSSATETLAVQIRPTGDPYDSPTSHVLGQVSVPESFVTSSDGWNIVTFASPIRDLSLSRRYALVLAQLSGSGSAARIPYADTTATGVTDSTDAGASWQSMSTRQMYARFYGTYTTPGTPSGVTRNYVSHVRIALQTGSQGFSRVDASAPLRNNPELLSAYWRTDFDRDPATTNANGDAVADWAVTGNTPFDTAQLANGVWTATGAIETRPLADFTTTTTVEVRCRNTTVGGNGAVLRINADRQGGQYAPILVYVKRQADGTQSLTLNGKTSDAATRQLFIRTNLPGGFVRYKLTILPNDNLVNLQINDEDQGTYTYSTYVPTTTTDRYLSLTSHISTAEFDYVDVRVGTN